MNHLARAALLTRNVLLTCGHTTVLHVGRHGDEAIAALREHGCDAQTLGVPVEQLLAEKRVRLPGANNSVEAVVAAECLESLTESQLSVLAREFHRVSRRYVLLDVELTAGQERDRQWWEHQFIAAGFRKALRSCVFQSFESLEHETGRIFIALEKLPPKALEEFPLSRLAEERDLHMDMLREAGRRSEAHVARYALACQFVRRHDRVLDAACGLGYGAAILQANTLADSVTGIDASASAVQYAAGCYGPLFKTLAFRQVELPDLRQWPDNSVDVVVSFETLEHLKAPATFLDEVHRILTPGGRFICSVPNRWVDETGKDPNPHHHHVFDFAALKTMVGRRLLLEQMFAQTAGGGMVLNDAPRRISAVAEAHITSGDPAGLKPAEWWLAVAMKDPWASPLPRYEERLYPEGGANPPSYLTFAQHYENPWLLRSMVTIGARATSRHLLRHIAVDTLARAAKNSADSGGALCVLLYQHLERLPQTDADFAAALERAVAYTKTGKTSNPHVKRWIISLRYVLGLIDAKLGNTARAAEHFEFCAAADCREFSPLLATKTVRAAHLAALLHLAQGRQAEAERLWRRGAQIAGEVFSQGLEPATGSLDAPPDFVLRELTQVLDYTQSCTNALNLASRAAEQRPLFSHFLNQSFSDELAFWKFSAAQLQAWTRELSDAQQWHSSHGQAVSAELSDIQADHRALQEELKRVQTWNEKLLAANDWNVAQNQSFQAKLDEHQKHIRQLKAWGDEQTKAREWHATQNESLQAKLEEHQKRIHELKAWGDEQTKAYEWHASQNESLQRQLENNARVFQEQQDWIAKLQRDIVELQQQLRAGRGQPPLT